MAIGDAAGTSFTFTGLTFKITSLDGPGLTNDAIDTTNLSTTTDKTYIPASISDGGELTLSGQFDSTLNVPIGTTATGTITWDTSETWAASMILTAFSPGAPGVGELKNFDATCKVSGDVTITT